jgi:hypothetical protein
VIKGMQQPPHIQLRDMKLHKLTSSCTASLPEARTEPLPGSPLRARRASDTKPRDRVSSVPQSSSIRRKAR